MKKNIIQKLLLALVLVVAWTTSDAQIRIDWQQCYGTNKADVAFDVAEIPDGFLILGQVETDGGGMYGCSQFEYHEDWMLNIDKGLDIADQRCERYGIHAELHESNNGSLYITELCNDSFLIQLRITRVDETGETQWVRHTGSLDGLHPLHNYNMVSFGVPTPDGGIVAAAICHDNSGDISHFYGGNADCWLVKYNADGTMAWETTLGTSGDDLVTCLAGAADGGILVGMDTPLSGGGNINCSPSGTEEGHVLVKLDASGEILWCRSFPDIEIKQALETEDGFLLAGEHASDCCLLRCDEEGNILWKKEYGGTCLDEVVRVFPNENGGFTVFANTKSTDGDIASAALLGVTGTEEGNVWVFHTDAEGTLLWERCIGSQLGLCEAVSNVIRNAENEYTLVGTMSWFDGVSSGDVSCSNNTLLPNSGDNIWLVHLILDLNFTDTEEAAASQTHILPNPTTGILSLSGDNLCQAEVFNSFGQRVDVWNGESSRVTLDLSKQPSGLYYIKTTDTNGRRSVQKVVKQ